MKLLKRIALFALVTAIIGAAGVAFLLHRALDRVEGAYFDAAGVRIHYTDEGAGEPVVLVHGFAFDADLNWRRPGITQALAQQYRVIALDNRGHGLSGKPLAPEAYGEEMPRDIVRLLDHLGIEKAHVVGYSMGGFITLKLLEMHPERLLSAAPCGIGWQEPTPENLALLEQIATALEQERSFAPLLRHLEIPVNESNPLVRAGMALFKARNDLGALAAVLRAFPGFQPDTERLRQNRVPALSIVGEDDPLASDVGRLHDTLARHALVRIPGKGHADAPGAPEFIETLMDFLVRPETYTP